MSAAENKAVFLSYASQDAEAARRICDSLRTAGVEVWFDQSELRGGDSWDAKIRKQIKECALFVPIISANTQARREGYFRIEWKLAAQRTHAIAEGTPFLLPIVIDDTPEPEALVPAEFRDVQWTRIDPASSGPAAPEAKVAAFGERVRGLLNGGPLGDPLRGGRSAAVQGAPASLTARRSGRGWVLAVAVTLCVIGFAAWYWPHRGSTRVSAASPGPETEAQRLITKIATIVDKDADATRDEWALADTMGAEAVRLEPGNPAAWGAYADAALGVYRFYYDRTASPLADALKRAQHALTLAPDSDEAKLVLARCYAQETRTYREAEEALRSLFARRPQDRRVLRALAALLRLRIRDQPRDRPANALEEAVEFCRRADALPGGDPVALREQAQLLASVTRFDEADAALDRSLALRAGPSALVTKIWIALAGRLDVEGACAMVAKLPGSYFLREDVSYVAALSWLWKREPQKCLAVLNGWRDEFLSSTPKAWLAGQAYRLQQRTEAALVAWRSALTAVEKQRAAVAGLPQEGELSFWKARLLAAVGEQSAAEELARAWRQAFPDQRNIKFAAMLVVLGKTDEALEALSRVPLSVWAGWTTPLRTYAAELRFDPAWDPLRSDPRFQALLATARQVQGGGTGEQSDKAPVLSAAPEKSVAVLAFENRSGEKDSEYFSDGISEELLNVLAKVPGLRVVGRTSSFQFKGKNTATSEIGRTLNVTHLVVGSVQKSGSRARIIASLIQTSSEQQVWSDGFNTDLQDILVAQQDIARKIAEQLSLSLVTTTRPTRAVNPEAHRRVLEARYFWARRTEEGFATAENSALQALKIDPQFAAAHAALADVYALRGWWRVLTGRLPSEPDFVRGRAEAELANRLDPTLFEPLATLGAIAFNLRQFDVAEDYFQKAFALNPNYAVAHFWRATLLMASGRLEDAFREYEIADRLDPLSFSMVDSYARALFNVGRYEEAREKYERAAAIRNDVPFTTAGRALVLLKLGRQTEAVALAREVVRSDLGDNRRWADATAAHVLRQAGFEAELRENRAQMLAKLPPDSYGRGLLLGVLGDLDAAIPFVERTPSPMFAWLYLAPEWDPWRGDARFQKLIEHLGCTKEYGFARASLERMRKEPAAQK